MVDVGRCSERISKVSSAIIGDKVSERRAHSKTRNVVFRFCCAEPHPNFSTSRDTWSNVKVPHLACQGVSTEFVLIGCVLRKRSVFILYFIHPHLFNENKLRTHTLQSKVRYFHVTPLALGTKFPLKPGRAATDETVGR